MLRRRNIVENDEFRSPVPARIRGMDTTLTTTRIIRRVEPCTCGCTGSDPWHARTFTRTVTDVREERGTATCYAERFDLRYDRVGLASAPWSDEKVVVVRWVPLDDTDTRPVGWIFAKDLRPGA